MGRGRLAPAAVHYAAAGHHGEAGGAGEELHLLGCKDHGGTAGKHHLLDVVAEDVLARVHVHDRQLQVEHVDIRPVVRAASARPTGCLRACQCRSDHLRS